MALLRTAFFQALYLYKKCVSSGVKARPIKKEIADNPNIFKMFKIKLDICL